MELALFRSSDPEVVANVVAMMLGAAALGGASQVTGEAVDSIMKWSAPAANDRRGLPHRLLVSVGAADVRLYASNRRGTRGPRLVTYPRGAFTAHLSRYPGEIDLTLDSTGQGRIVVTGTWGLFHHSCIRAAKAAVALPRGLPFD